MRANSAPLLRSNDRSVTCRSASRQNAYPGWTAKAFRDQKLVSASRKSGRQPIHPTARTARTTIAAPTPVTSASLPEASPIQAVSTSGATPSSTAGSRIETNHANRSFVRLISASRLPAIARSERCLVAEWSLSMSPRRGSRRGLAATGARRIRSDLAGTSFTVAFASR
jgi:hypothetical protein